MGNSDISTFTHFYSVPAGSILSRAEFGNLKFSVWDFTGSLLQPDLNTFFEKL